MKNILIAEDEKPMATALELKLKKAGFSANAVYDGRTAISRLQETKYDLILLDLMMPEVDGFEVLKKIKELKLNVVVFVLSNLSQEEDRKKSMEFGAKEYFVKSDTPIADIVKKVSDFLQAKK